MMRLALAVLALVVAVGCSDGPLGPEDVAGTYDLVSINAQPLPHLTIESSELRLRASGVAVLTVCSDECIVTEAPYTLSGDRLVIDAPDETIEGKVDGRTITLMAMYLYRKR